jgi:hypothetical protein
MFTTNPTWTKLESKLGIQGERPATNTLSHDRAEIIKYVHTEFEYIIKTEITYPQIKKFSCAVGPLGHYKNKIIDSSYYNISANICRRRRIYTASPKLKHLSQLVLK